MEILFAYLFIYLFIIVAVYLAGWYIYKWWVKAQSLNVLIYTLVSSVVFISVTITYILVILTSSSVSWNTIGQIGIVIPLIFVLTFPMTKPVLQGSIALWKKMKF